LDAPAFGIMFDSDLSGSDSNNVAREGVAISSHIQLPNDERRGTERGKRFGTAKAPYFRTVVHELEHAFGLLHNENPVDNSFMNGTAIIRGKATAANPFDNLIKWNYADENLKQLRHWPDVFVRPGGVEFALATNSNPLITPDDSAVEIPDLELVVEPLLKEVPIGAPVRVNVTLANRGNEAVVIPEDIGLKSSHMTGVVSDLSGVERSFRPPVCYEKLEQVAKSRAWKEHHDIFDSASWLSRCLVPD